MPPHRETIIKFRISQPQLRLLQLLLVDFTMEFQTMYKHRIQAFRKTFTFLIDRNKLFCRTYCNLKAHFLQCMYQIEDLFSHHGQENNTEQDCMRSTICPVWQDFLIQGCSQECYLISPYLQHIPEHMLLDPIAIKSRLGLHDLTAQNSMPKLRTVDNEEEQMDWKKMESGL